ncbi:uncharacterized protein LOC122656964 [Telopea speciosissima]|uniref:uncharacterized protein LOC122656964 n=1 Tax=Telopea speciosissima TaxID=54955 RepID=UPI001CC42F8A|nr:uncharacterized protein LOC122656964 [Telopea speciosissima]
MIAKWVKLFGEGNSQQKGTMISGRVGLLGMPGYNPCTEAASAMTAQVTPFVAMMMVEGIGPFVAVPIQQPLNPMAQPWYPGLNPMASAWYPWLPQVPRKHKRLFLTFSNGHPLTEEEIVNFFRDKYGDCVEDVFVHHPEEGFPLFGNVVFRTESMVDLVMNGQEKVKFTVARKPLWCRKFKPKNQRIGGGTINKEELV